MSRSEQTYYAGLTVARGVELRRVLGRALPASPEAAELARNGGPCVVVAEPGDERTIGDVVEVDDDGVIGGAS